MKFYNGIYKSQRDTRDYLARSFLRYKGLPTKYSLRQKMPIVKNQGPEGSCAGHAGSYAKEYQEEIDTGKYIRLSPRYIYDLAKKISGHSEGTTLKAICEVLLKCGICEEKYWSYIPNNPGGRSPKADDNASKYKILSYARITDIDELKQAIYEDSEIKTAFCGIKLYKGAVGDEAKNTGVTPDPTCWERFSAIGGHALYPTGWNDFSPYYKNDGHIEFLGSWGEDFGDKGYHYFSYKNLKSNMLDAMAIVDITGSAKIMTVANLPRGKWWV